MHIFIKHKSYPENSFMIEVQNIQSLKIEGNFLDVTYNNEKKESYFFADKEEAVNAMEQIARALEAIIVTK